MYYNYQQISTYIQPIKCIVGGEGIGKTYGLKSLLLDRLFSSKEPFEVAWFIRYDVDITPTYIQKWQDDLPIDIKERIRTDGRILYVDNSPFVYFLALSKFITGKGVPYPQVKYAVFDEFILDKDSRYLPNEIFAFKRWTQSLFRLRPVNWFLLANALSFDNPYFNYFGVKKQANSEWFSNNKIVVHFPKANAEFLKKAKKADYYKLFQDEETERYGLNAEFYFDNTEFISSKPKGCKPMFNIKVGKHIFGLWEASNTLWLGQSNKGSVVYALGKSDTADGTLFNPNMARLLTEAYTSNLLWFEGLTLKNEVLDKLKCLK